jgi:hypothetical protein
MAEYIKKRTFPKKETDFILSFMTELKKKRGEVIWSFKSHGEPMQTRGIPDVILCYMCLFVGLEFKIMRHGKLEPTPYQEYNLEMINKAGGLGIIVWWDEKNGEVGIGVKRFESQDKAICFLVEILDNYAKIPPEKLLEIKRGAKQ